MARGHLDRTEHGEVQAQFPGPRQFLPIVHRRAHPPVGRPLADVRQRFRRQMDSIGGLPQCARMTAVHEQPRSSRTGQREHLPEEPVDLRGGEVRLAQLDEPESAGERVAQSSKERIDAQDTRRADSIDRRQLESAEHRNGGRQQGRRKRIEREESEALALSCMQFATPLEHPAEVQANERVRIVEDPDDPGMHRPDVDAEFFVQFTLQCVRHGFARLELSPGNSQYPA